MRAARLKLTVIGMGLAIAAWGLTGCATDDHDHHGRHDHDFDHDQGRYGPEYGRDRGRHWHDRDDEDTRNIIYTTDPHAAGPYWRYRSDPDRIAPYLPLNPEYPPSATPMIPLPPGYKQQAP